LETGRGIVVGNLLTGFVAAVLWLLFVASLLSGSLNGARDADQSSAIPTEANYQAAERSSQSADVRDWPSARGRRLSAPDANGCIKGLA
jgi:hypothetical protein